MAGQERRSQPYRRLLNRVRTLYLKDDFSAAMPLGQADTLALPFESYKQGFTPGLLTAVYGGKISVTDLSSVLQSVGQYRELDGDGSYWIPSGRAFFSSNPSAPDSSFSRAHFYLVQAVQDPFGGVGLLTHDADDLLVLSTQDALGNVASVQNDYRVLAPSALTDPNGNRAAVSFDVLGFVAGSAVMGKSSENLGDSLDGFVSDLTQDQIDGFFAAADPHSAAGPLLASASMRIIYDVNRFQTTQAANPTDRTLWEPAFSAAIARETHVSDLAANQQMRFRSASRIRTASVARFRKRARPSRKPPVVRCAGSAPAGRSSTTRGSRSANMSRFSAGCRSVRMRSSSG